jgi:hypothetical protein
LGIAFVLAFYLGVLGVAAAISGSLFRAATRLYLNTVPLRQAKAARQAAFFPFACMVFAGIWFVSYAAISEAVFHRDPMIGDSWFTNIGNGYAIGMIDIMDQGVLYPSDGGMNGPGAIDGVRRLQIVGGQIFGTRDTKSFEHFGSELQVEDAFFSLNTRSYVKKNFPTEASLASYVESEGIRFKLEPIGNVYERYRIGWFDWLAGLFLVCVPAYAFWRLLRYIRLVKLNNTPN